MPSTHLIEVLSKQHPAFVTTQKTMSSLEDSQNSSRSCITCRQRKIRCDKRSPCSGCQKDKFSCAYPPKVHSRKRMQPESNQDLKLRLKRLEDLVQSLKEASDKDEKSLPAVNSNSSVRRNNADQGRLVVEGGETRYIENSFWITLSNEVT